MSTCKSWGLEVWQTTMPSQRLTLWSKTFHARPDFWLSPRFNEAVDGTLAAPSEYLEIVVRRL